SSRSSYRSTCNHISLPWRTELMVTTLKIKTWTDDSLKGDKVIWAVVFALPLISILVVYSSIGTLAYKRMVSPERLIITHTLHVIIGLAAMWFAHKVDYRYYS